MALCRRYASEDEEDEDAVEVEDSMPLQNLDDVAVAVAAVVDKAKSENRVHSLLVFRLLCVWWRDSSYCAGAHCFGEEDDLQHQAQGRSLPPEGRGPRDLFRASGLDSRRARTASGTAQVVMHILRYAIHRTSSRIIVHQFFNLRTSRSTLNRIVIELSWLLWLNNLPVMRFPSTSP